MKRLTGVIAAVAAMCLALSVSPAALADQGADKGADLRGTRVVSIENAFVRASMTEEGSLVVGTTGGDPAIAGDDNKPLLFGFDLPGGAVTGYPSMRVIKGGAITDRILIQEPRTQAPTVEQDRLVVRWVVEGVEVSQFASLRLNPYTSRDDMVQVAYTLRNTNAGSVQAGVRCMLDILVGGNDYAPFFVPGVGTVSQEREFGAGDMPSYFKAFESGSYSSNSLRAQGLLRGSGLTTPQRFVFATWRANRGGGAGIYLTAWDYAITPGATLGDSAIAYWWGPYTLAAGQEVQVVTGYGLGGEGGGNAWLDAPARLGCVESEFDANLWVANTASETLFNGRATVALPAGLSFAAGQNAVQFLGDILPGHTGAAAWRVLTGARSAQDQQVTYGASVSFDNLARPFQPQKTVLLAHCVEPPPPTATVSPTNAPTPAVPTPTPAIPPPTPSPSPVPEVPEPTSLVLLATGLAGLGVWARASGRLRRR